MNGSMACVARVDNRSRKGSATPAMQPITKPDAETRIVATMSVSSLPLPAISTMRCAVASGGAKNNGPSERAAHSQASSSATPSRIRPPVTIHCRGMARLSGRSDVMSAAVMTRPPGCARRSRRSPAL